MKAEGAFDQDPMRDQALRRALQTAADAPLTEAAAHRLEAAIMSAVRRGVADGVTTAWWEVAARWAPAAAAAGVAAVLVSGALIFGTLRSSAPGDEAAPETAAVAQVIGRYSGDAVLASLLSGDQPDALSPWGDP